MATLTPTRGFRAAGPYVLLSVLAACGGEEPEPAGPGLPQIARVVVVPSSDTAKVGELQAFAAHAEAANGQRLSGAATFASSDETIASFSLAGVMAAKRTGVVIVTATIGGVTGQATLRVAPAIILGPRLPSVLAGDTLQLAFQVLTAVGGPPGPVPFFTSRSPAVAQVSAGGLITAGTPGLVTIVATSEVTAESLTVAVVKQQTGPNREIAAACTLALRLCLYGATVDTLTPPGKRVIGYAWSGDGNRLAVLYELPAGTTELWVMAPDGSGATLLTSTAAANGSPAISPDGHRVVFEGPGNALWIRDIPLGTTLPLTAEPLAQESDPQFSPDGRQVAFRSNGIVKIQATAQVTPVRSVTVPGIAASFRWSPDGKWLAVASLGFDSNSTPTWFGIWLVRPDGTGLRPLSPNCGPGLTCVGTVGDYHEPRWSPDATRVGMWYFSLVGGVLTPGFEVRHASAATLVSAFQYPTLSLPDWSPDGLRLAWTGYPPGGAAGTVLFTSLPDGTGRQQVSSDTVTGRAIWRP